MSPILSIHHPASQPVTRGQNFGEPQVSKSENILAIDDRIATTDRLELDITTLQRQLTAIVDRQDAKALIEATDATRAELFQHLRQA
jgi:hypothetical protein